MADEHTTESRTTEVQDQPQDMTVGRDTEGGEEAVAERGADAARAKERKGASEEHADFEREQEEAKEEIRRLEDNPPEKLEDWPEGKAKYETYGGPEGEHGYHEGPEAQLGPDSLRHREDGSVEVAGEEVEHPEEYKGAPVPGGPTDPDTPNLRMDKASPEDVSDIAREAAEKEEGSSEERESGA